MSELIARRWYRQTRPLCFIVFACAGCYRYTAAPASTLRPGMHVRATLSASEVERMRRLSGTHAQMLNGFNISGQVAEVGSDSLLLTISTDVYQGDFRTNTLLQSVQLPRAFVASTEVRTLDKWRTGALVVGGALVAASLVDAALRGGGASGHIPVIGGPPENRLPIGTGRRVP